MMEKPDASGAIYVSWPSKNIPHGGLMHTRVVTHTPDTEKFLKELLQESRLASEQRRGPRARPAPARAPAPPPHRPHTSRRRSLQTIRASAADDEHAWRPLERIEDREELKERLRDALLGAAATRAAAPPAPPAPPAARLPDTHDRAHELIEQIRERADWLREMEALGEGGPHRSVVHDQIAARVRELDALCPRERAPESSGSAALTARSTNSSLANSAKGSNAAKLTTRPHSVRSAARGVSARTASSLPRGPRRALHEDVAQLNALAVRRAGGDE